jgi:hypothetical protein
LIGTIYVVPCIFIGGIKMRRRFEDGKRLALPMLEDLHWDFFGYRPVTDPVTKFSNSPEN